MVVNGIAKQIRSKKIQYFLILSKNKLLMKSSLATKNNYIISFFPVVNPNYLILLMFLLEDFFYK